ncbi:MAG: adenylyl-sulfate kinase, partial [Jatrophihabitans sp.]
MSDDPSTWQVHQLDADTAADIALLLSGIRLPLTGPIRLCDGENLIVQTDLFADTEEIVLADEESTPIARLIADRFGRGHHLEPMGPTTAQPWDPYLIRPTAIRAIVDPAATAILCDRPLTALAEEQLRAYGGPVLIFAQLRGGKLPDDVLVRCLQDSVAHIQGAALIAVPLAARNVTATTKTDLATQFGISTVLSTVNEPTWADVLAALDDEDSLPSKFGSAFTRTALREWRPPLTARGLAILFTGLSGSGKSTIAAAVVGRLALNKRRATLLDGDRVRRLLSSGLSFSREDRETNVRRIGWVAAQIAVHGGIAVCAPIAPYAATREWVRREVSMHGDFLLVHVATPLAVCEARDRKGLYAAARAGNIPLFTGISDPYEEPSKADLVLDTANRSIDSCVDEVMGKLTAGGGGGQADEGKKPTKKRK